MQTERGLIYVEAEYQSEERAIMDGYTYAWYSHQLGAKVYSKVMDKLGHIRKFALIVGY